jgi:hypothetical protein
MSLVYIMLGSAMLGNSPFFKDIPRNYTLIVGVAMIGYGCFRGYRVYQKYFANHEE